MKKTTFLASVLAAILIGAASAEGAPFMAGHLVVLRAGDGLVKQKLKQAPVFLDEFDPKIFNANPISTVAIPTNGADAFFFNSHAATEGMLSRSADGRELVFGGYGGVNLLEKPGTPSMLDIKRGFVTVDAKGTLHTFLYQPVQTDVKSNPRGAATDGEGNFWGCGNSGGNLFFNSAGGRGIVEFENVESTRDLKIINHSLYVSLNGPDGTVMDKPAGIYQFADKHGGAVPLPREPGVALAVVVPTGTNFAHVAGFDMNPEKTIAYLADTTAGIQKYVKAGDNWKLAYNFPIPQNIAAAENHGTGCFGLVVDFKGSAPVIYATTTEGFGGTVNSNRVVCIVDTNATAVVTTVAQASSDNIAFRGIEFAPEDKR